MANMVHCPNCGRNVPRPAGPDGVCPACRKPLPPASPSSSAISSPSIDELLPDVDEAPPVRPTTRPGIPVVEAAERRRPQSESSRAATRMANAPTFKSTSARGGVPILPIAAGVVLILAITVFALIRGRPAPPAAAAIPSMELQVTTIGRPPEPTTPPLAEPDPSAPVVTMDLPPESMPTARERRKAGEREAAARAARAAAPPAKELARNEKPAATARPAVAPRAEPKAEPRLEARAEPEPAPLPPPQFVAAPASEQPNAAAPLAIGPAYAREGYQKARLAKPGCVAGMLGQSRDMANLEGETATVKFAVDEAGKVSQYTYLSGPTDPRISNAIRGAVERCEWLPGATAQGRPLALWVTMPIKFGK